ncbi:MAG: sensor histidine kinase, partial [Eubacteriaceae bacterium]|nr:sensor histidine kinase [Eubacteriaceae bacterium]
EVLDGELKHVDGTKEAPLSSEWNYSFTYAILRDGDGAVMDVLYDSGHSDYEEVWTVKMKITDFGFRYALFLRLLHLGFVMRYAVYAVIILSLAFAVISFAELMKAAGHVPDREELSPGPFSKIPFDLLAVFWGAAVFGAVMLADMANLEPFAEIIVLALIGILGACAALGLLMGAAVRIKQGDLIRGSLVFRLMSLALRGVSKMISALRKAFSVMAALLGSVPLVWKSLLAMIVLSAAELSLIVVFRWDMDLMILAFAFEKILVSCAVMYMAVSMKKLKAAGAALAGGDLSYVTDTKGMIWDLKEHSEDLNSIAKGMGIAVEERLRSERMKTELITNVSHDIKTPLTSIISYASLIGREKHESETVNHYAQVLVKQSERLRRLLDDLVEASKASTGNLDVELSECSASMFISQAAGEYEDRLREADLELITKLPEQDIRIMADGRRMWRIFDNLMNNIVKYAQKGTRVYLSLEQVKGNAVITFKNTSRDKLDMTEEELMERFTRGDVSRSTEGNGLGLAIAKSLAQLQGGELRIFIDGDFFRAVLCFPAIEK